MVGRPASKCFDASERVSICEFLNDEIRDSPCAAQPLRMRSDFSECLPGFRAGVGASAVIRASFFFFGFALGAVASGTLMNSAPTAACVLFLGYAAPRRATCRGFRWSRCVCHCSVVTALLLPFGIAMCDCLKHAEKCGFFFVDPSVSTRLHTAAGADHSHLKP